MRVSRAFDERRDQLRDLLQLVRDYAMLDVSTLIERLDKDATFVDALDAVVEGQTGIFKSMDAVREFCAQQLYGTPLPHLEYAYESRPRVQIQTASPYDVPVRLVKEFLPQRLRATFDTRKLHLFTRDVWLPQQVYSTVDATPIRAWSLLTHVWVRAVGTAPKPRKTSFQLVENGNVLVNNHDVFTYDVPRPLLHVQDRIALYQISFTDNGTPVDPDPKCGHFVGLTGWEYPDS